MIAERLEVHVKRLCIRNLKSKRIKCCSQCPFEDDIIKHFPNLKKMFEQKRKLNENPTT